MLKPGDEYTCTICGETYKTTWSDGDAMENYRKEFNEPASHRMNSEGLNIVCQDCYDEAMAKAGRLN